VTIALGGYGGEVPFEYYRWLFAERYGWSLEYIDNLKLSDFFEWVQIETGKSKAKQVK
jgi:hypothetical protein